MIVFRAFGNWTAAGLALKSLPVLLKSSGHWGQRKVANKLIRIVKGHIDNQDLGWISLSGSTNSGDSRILVDTEVYYNSIKAWRKGGIQYVGVPNHAYYPNGNSVSDIAMMHEFGLGNNPQRPLWAPSYEELGGAEGVRKIIGEVIFNKVKLLRSKGFEVVSGL